MNKAVDLDRIIRNFSHVKEEMDKGHWVHISTPDRHDIPLGSFYDDFKIWIEKCIEDAKIKFEAL